MSAVVPLVTIAVIVVAIAGVLLEFAKPLPSLVKPKFSKPVAPPGTMELVQSVVLSFGTGLTSMVAGVDPGIPDQWMTGDEVPDARSAMRLTVAWAAFVLVEEASGNAEMAQSWLISDQDDEGTSAVALLQQGQFAEVLKSARIVAAQQ